MGKQRVILIGGSVGMLNGLSTVVGSAGFEAEIILSKSDLVIRLRRDSFAAVILGCHSVGRDDLALLRTIREEAPEADLIVAALEPNLDMAIEAVRQGALDFLRMPDDLDRLSSLLKTIADEIASEDVIPLKARAYGSRQPSSEASAPWQENVRHGSQRRHEVPPVTRPSGHEGCRTTLIGESPAIRNARRLIAEMAPTDITVLIRGESGTGKDIVARMLHELSNRKGRGNFTKTNCPTIPESLFESELFGYEKGAFTGALTQKPGRFELAEHGTFFLDEIGSISMAMQAKLLEVIEHKQFMRVGGKSVIRVDTRIVAATHCPLEKMIGRGDFRADLFYRLRQFTITLPPLRDRIEDIPLLAQRFLNDYSARYEMEPTQLPPQIIPQLLGYRWPGNVRELEGVMARYALTRDLAVLEAAVREDGAREDAAPITGNRLREAEASSILAVLGEMRWNQRQAAAELGISYSALRRRITKYNLIEARDAAYPGSASRSNVVAYPRDRMVD